MQHLGCHAVKRLRRKGNIQNVKMHLGPNPTGALAEEDSSAF